jgi:PAS domain S-box-containing protein
MKRMKPTKDNLMIELSEARLLIDELKKSLSDNRKIDEVIKESEKRYRLLADNARDVIWVLDENLRYAYVSPSTEKLRGYKHEEVMSQTMDQVLAPESFQRAVGIFLKEFELEMNGMRHQPDWSMTLELELICKDGSTVWTEVNISLIYDESGNPKGILGQTRDIGERKRAEEALRSSEAKYRFLTENMNDIVWTADLNFNITYDSPATERILGFTVAERMTQKAEKMITPESYAHILKTLSAELERENELGADPNRSVKLELEYYHKNGSTVWMESVVTAIRDDSGKLVGMQGVSRDIMDRRRAESALRESERRFRTIFQKSLDIIVTLDGSGSMVFGSPSVQSILGYAPGDLMGRSPLELIHPDDLEGVIKDLEEVYQKTNRGMPSEFRLLKADGTWVHLEANGQNLLDDPAIGGIVITARDITMRKHVEEELRKHRDHLEDLVRERTVKLVKAKEDLEKQIEERKRAEDALRVNEEIYRIHFSFSHDILFTSNEESRIISITPNVKRVLGYKPQELVGKTLEEAHVLHSDDMTGAFDYARRLLSGEVMGRQTYRFITKDGKTKYGEVSGVPLMRKGFSSTLISVARDVTERVEKEQALTETLDRYQAHFSLTDDVLVSLDNKLKIKSISPNVKKVLGYDPEDLVGEPAHKLGIMASEYINEAWDEALHLLSGQTINNSIYEFIRADGRRIFGEVSSSPVIRDGRVVEIVSVCREITERIRKEKSLRENEATAQALLNACTDFMVLIDTTGRILHMNKKASENLGKEVHELLRTSVFDHMPKEVAKRRKIYFDQVISSCRPVRFEDENGGRMFNSSLFPVCNEMGKVAKIVIYARDVTESKQEPAKIRM